MIGSDLTVPWLILKWAGSGIFWNFRVLLLYIKCPLFKQIFLQKGYIFAIIKNI